MTMHDKITVVDNFFSSPEKVVTLSKKLSYSSSPVFPGKRTINLLDSGDPELIEFAKFFSKKLADEVMYGIKNFYIDISFHKNDVYNDKLLNQGWIHSDPVEIAGLVYLSSPLDFNAGTSMYSKKDNVTFESFDVDSRNNFNISGQATTSYTEDLAKNHSYFEKTTQVGHVFNRLVAYDSSIWHAPNFYELNDNSERLSLLFFINQYEYEKPKSLLTMSSTWRD